MGSTSGQGAAVANDEREQTLKQLSPEMDGFDQVMGILVLAASNPTRGQTESGTPRGRLTNTHYACGWPTCGWQADSLSPRYFWEVGRVIDPVVVQFPALKHMAWSKAGASAVGLFRRGLVVVAVLDAGIGTGDQLRVLDHPVTGVEAAAVGDEDG